MYKDELTGLFNRKYLRTYAEQEIKRAKRYMSSFSILIIDLDNFKEINDTMGHLTGDMALKKTSAVIMESIRESDIPTRYGGDEFVILLPDTSYRGAYRVAGRLLENLKREYIKGIKLSCSIGISTFPDDGVIWEELFEKADKSLYSAKRSGKGKIGSSTHRITQLRIPLPQLVGRREEVSKILSFFKTPGKLHLIVGEAGVGKTRIVNSALVSFSQFLVLKAGASGAIREIPYFAIREVLKNLFFSQQGIFEKTLAQMPLILKEEITKLTPFYTKNTIQKTDFKPDKYTLYESISRFFNYLVSHKDAILFIDDFHWIDSQSAKLFYYLLRMSPDVYYIGAIRNNEIKGTKAEEILLLLGRERLYDTLKLDNLGKTATKQMAEGILGNIITNKLLDFVYGESGGNPFFIEEILRNLNASNAIEMENNMWFLKDAHIIIPNTIEDVINQKLRNLPRRYIDFLEHLATIGIHLDPSFVAYTLNRDEGEVYDMLDTLVKETLLINYNDQYYHFKEGIIKDVILKNISRGKLIRLHRSIGLSLEKFYHRTLNEHLEELVYHFKEGKVKDKLVEYAVKAADMAMKMYAYERAIIFYKWAEEATTDENKKAEIYFKLAESFNLYGDSENALTFYKKAYLINRTSHLAEKIGDTFSRLGQSQKAIKWFETAIREAENEEKKLLYQLDIAWEYNINGKTKEANLTAKKALSELKTENCDVLGMAYNIMGAILMHMGEYEDAEEHFFKSIDFRKQSEDKKALAGSYNNLGILYDNMQRYKDAIKNYKEALSLYREISYKEGEAIMAYNIGLLHYAEGNFEIALKHLKEAKNIFEPMNSRYYLSLLYNNLGLMFEILGLYKEALPFYMKSLHIAKELGHEAAILEAKLSIFKFHIITRQYNEAEKMIDEILSFEANYKNEPTLITIYDILTLFHEKRKETKTALDYAIKSFELTKKITKDLQDKSYCLAYYTLAKLYAENNHFQKAWEFLTLAEEHPYNEKIKGLAEITRAYFDRIKAYTYFSMGEKDKASNLFKKALSVFESKNHIEYIEEITNFLLKQQS